MAIIETIKIEGDASDFNQALIELNKRIEGLEGELVKANSEIKEFGNKGEKAVKGVKEEIKATGKSVKDLIRNLGGLAIASQMADVAKETLTGSREVSNFFETSQNFISLGISGLVSYASGAQNASQAFGNLWGSASELTQMRQQSQLADVRQLEIQFTYQKLAEQQRQIRDDETQSIFTRINANETLNNVLIEQLDKEKEAVQVKIDAAQAEFNRLNNIENEVALRQAQVEMLDVEERIIGQRSEYLSNELALTRELSEAERIVYERRIERGEAAIEFGRRFNEINRIDALTALRSEMELTQRNYDFKKDMFEKEMDLYDRDSLAYQQLLSEKQAMDSEYSSFLDESNLKEYYLMQEVEAAKFQLVKDSFNALGQLSAAFAGEDEESKRRQFEFQKKLSLASAIVSGTEAVQNAYKTAQGSPYTALNPAYPTIQAGLAAAFAAAQVATIARSKFESSSLSSSSFGGTATTAPSQPAQFNIIGQGGTNQLVEGIAGTFERPIRAYVVSGEVISGGELQRRRLRTATFG